MIIADGTRIEMDGTWDEDGCDYTTHWKEAGKDSQNYIAHIEGDDSGTGKYKSEDGRWTGSSFCR